MQTEQEENKDFATIQTLSLDRNEIKEQNNIISDSQEQSQIPQTPQSPKDPKFKTFDSLEKAYSDLQAEFTKKSQELAELKKQNADKVQSNNEDSTPAFMKEDWGQKVQEFFEENEFAKQYKVDISKLLVEDQDLRNDKNPLQKALVKVLSSKSFSPSKLIDDENFLKDYIYSNDKIKDKIINDYLLNFKKSSPNLITKTFASSLGSTKNSQPKTLKEVKELVRKMFI